MVATKEYSTFKKDAIANQPAFYDTQLKHVDVEGIDSVTVEGKSVPMTQEALMSLQDLVKMPRRFSNHVSNVLGDDKRLELLSALRSALSSLDDMHVSAMVDADEGQITGFAKRGSRLTMEDFFNVFERTVDRYDLELSDMSGSGASGLTLTVDSRGRQVELRDFTDEVFKTGLGFSIESGQMDLLTYQRRLICTNGMYRMDWAEEGMGIDEVTAKKMTSLFLSLDKLSEQHFIPSDFASRVGQAKQTSASVAEMERVHRMINGHSQTDGYNPHTSTFTGFEEVKSEYLNIGFDISDMNRYQKRNAQTNVSVWDLVNGLTRFASHDQSGRGYNFGDNAATRMQKQAGQMFSKEYDCNNLVPSPFGGMPNISKN